MGDISVSPGYQQNFLSPVFSGNSSMFYPKNTRPVLLQHWSPVLFFARYFIRGGGYNDVICGSPLYVRPFMYFDSQPLFYFNFTYDKNFISATASRPIKMFLKMSNSCDTVLIMYRTYSVRCQAHINSIDDFQGLGAHFQENFRIFMWIIPFIGNVYGGTD